MRIPYRAPAIFILMAAFAAAIGCEKKPAFSAADQPTDRGMVIPKGMPGGTPPKENRVK